MPTARSFEDIPDPALAELGASSLGLSDEDVAFARCLAEERYSAGARLSQEQVFAWSDRVLAQMQGHLGDAP